MLHWWLLLMLWNGLDSWEASSRLSAWCQEFQEFLTTNQNQQWLIAGRTRLSTIAMENHRIHVNHVKSSIYIYFYGPWLRYIKWPKGSWPPISLRLCNSFLSAGLSTGTSTRSAHWRISKITRDFPEKGAVFPSEDQNCWGASSPASS